VQRAVGADAVVGGHEPGHAAEGGRADDRADRLRAERQREEAGGHTRGRPVAGASGRVRRVVWVPGRARRRVGELRRAGLAEHQRAGGPEGADRGRLGAAEALGRHGRSRAGGQAIHPQHVLDADQRAEQRRSVAGVGMPRDQLGGVGVQARAAPGLWNEGQQGGLQRLGPVQEGVDVIVEVEVAGAQGGDSVDQGNGRDVAHRPRTSEMARWETTREPPPPIPQENHALSRPGSPESSRRTRRQPRATPPHAPPDVPAAEGHPAPRTCRPPRPPRPALPRTCDVLFTLVADL
jgi:hypothetical protein